MGSDYSLTKQVILFDGVCNLCNSSVQFILKRDHENRFLFSSLQSSYAKENLPFDLVKENDLQSIILTNGHELKTKSTAALTIAKQLSGIWPVLYVFIIIPEPIRNIIYDFIAKNRYKWFGKRDVCMIPSPELRNRFID